MRWRERAAWLLREPLPHFLIAGALVYILLAGRAPDLGERRIVVSEAVVSQLAARWNQAYRRLPSPAELDGLIVDYVRDQAYYREALRLGLDRDDDVVVRRMRNKMIALATSAAEAATPNDAQLQALLDKNPARYAPETRFTFDQVYLGPDDEATRMAAPGALAALSRGGNPAPFAQPVAIPASFAAVPASEVAGLLGDDFVKALRLQQQGAWHGPVASAVGLHLVRVTVRTADAKPRLADVRQALENDWRADARRKAEDAAYRRILDGYDVKIEMPR